MRADEVYAILKGKLVKLTEDIKSMGDWKPIQHKGTVQTADDLPTDAKEGWMYNIATDSIYGAAGMNVVMTSEGWDPMGPIINMGPYLTKEEGNKTFQPKGNYLSGTDSDLKESGKAADAKVTGEKIAKNSSDITKKLDKNQGVENSGKIAGINESGDIVLMFPVGVEYNSETNCLEFGSDQKMKLNQGIGLDSTLTKTGSAADAGATGKEINSLKEDLVNIQDVIGGEKTEHFNTSSFEPCYPIHTGTGVRQYDKWATSVASNDLFFNFEYDVDVYSDVADGYEFVLLIYNEDASHNKTYDYSDTTGLVRVPKNTNFRIMFRKHGVSVIDVEDVNRHVFFKYESRGIKDDVDDIKTDIQSLKADVNAVNDISKEKALDPSVFEACYPINTYTGIREYSKYSTADASNDDFFVISVDTKIYSDIEDGYRFKCFVYEKNGTFVKSYDYADTIDGITISSPAFIRLNISSVGQTVIDVEDACSHIYFSSDIISSKLTSERLSRRFTDDIVEHNADMLDAVNAASLYGVHYLEYNSKKCCSMLVTTDIHKSVDRHIAALRYLESIDSIDIGCCLGDIQAGNYSENDGTWFTSPVANLNKPYLVAIGNHDCGNGTNGNTSGTTSEVVKKFITPIEDKMGKSNLDVPYYSYDDETHKMHFIVLYNFDSPDIKDDDGNFAFFRGGECLSQAQLNWFAADLNGVKSGYSVVILMHSFWFPNTPIECSFSQPNSVLGGNNRAGYEESDNIIPKIVNAYMNREIIAETFAPKTEYADILPTLNANYDFTSASGIFVCYLVGHSHKDVVAHSTQYNNQLVIGFCATALDAYQNINSDIPRTRDTKSEDAITVVAFNNAKRRVNMVRIGSNITINMVKRDYISIPY